MGWQGERVTGFAGAWSGCLGAKVGLNPTLGYQIHWLLAVKGQLRCHNAARSQGMRKRCLNWIWWIDWHFGGYFRGAFGLFKKKIMFTVLTFCLAFRAWPRALIHLWQWLNSLNVIRFLKLHWLSVPNSGLIRRKKVNVKFFGICLSVAGNWLSLYSGIR